MGALRIDECENGEGLEQAGRVSSPRLILTSYEDEPTAYEEEPTANEAKPAPRLSEKARLRRASRRRRDNVCLSAAAACLVVFGVAGAWSSISARTQTDLQPRTITVTVQPGDSLWKYARRFGSPDRYILDRVSDLARTNSLSNREALVPGQRLKIPVTNPAELARIESDRELKLARR